MIIDKVVIITKSKKADNLHLLENINGVKFYFAADLKRLLLEIGKNFIARDFSEIK